MSQQLDPNAMIFYDNYEAPLPAGLYRFVLQQTVNVEGDAARHYYRDQIFEVLAPRYSIDRDEIQAYFPPVGGVADYRNVLPHVVLLSRNLPWERPLSAQKEPWLALLVLSEQDHADGRVFFWKDSVARLAPQRPDNWKDGDDDSLWNWWHGKGNDAILVPEFTRTEDANTPVLLLDLDIDLFLKVCPSRKELPLLAHIRHVDTADKVPLEMVANGEFSVLVANRFPTLGTNTVYLVSLEGWTELLDAQSSAGQPASRLRMITLGSWTFNNDPNGNDTFGGVMTLLKENSKVIGVALPGTSGNDHVDKAFERGYVPLDYKPWQSTPALAWYRGPLAPLTHKPLNRSAFERADAALIIDNAQGVIDLSYASAWELGRLLALSSPAFTKGMRLFVEQRQSAAEFTKEINDFIDLHRSSFKVPISDGGPSEQITIAGDLIEWIARLVLLYPVPFHYLIPHQSLLPSESLRFFHLDDNWIDALVDGTLSIAVQDLADQNQASRVDLQASLSKIVYQHRLRLQGKQPEFDPKERYMDIPKSGFLLRSRLVTAWPGVEITVNSSGTKDQTLPTILRFDEVAEGVLLCLARGSVEQVTFREPREGITFGVGSDGKLQASKTGKTLDVKKDLLRTTAPVGVVDITKLQEQLTTTGSAEFATQMIRKPEELSINWNKPS